MKSNARCPRKARCPRRDLRLRKVLLALICALAVSLAGGTLAPARAQSPVTDTSPVIHVAEKNANSVVTIIVTREYYTDSSFSETQVGSGHGSGVVIAEGGYILTNAHVVCEEYNLFFRDDPGFADSYIVVLPDGLRTYADPVGYDARTDLAVLKVREYADRLVPVTIGKSADLRVGSTVVAIGTPFDISMRNTVTQGAVSATDRLVEEAGGTRFGRYSMSMIQHDAPIYSGNSGGGLFDVQGDLVGINSMITTPDKNSGWAGVSLAIPVDLAYPYALAMIENGQIERPLAGISITNYKGPDMPMDDQPPMSALVRGVSGPAAQAGIREWDFIYAVNGAHIYDPDTLVAQMGKYKPGDTVTMSVARYGSVEYLGQADGELYGNNYSLRVSGGCELLELPVTLASADGTIPAVAPSNSPEPETEKAEPGKAGSNKADDAESDEGGEPFMGVVVNEYNGPDEPADDHAPKSMILFETRGPAAKSDLREWDFIYAIDGVRTDNIDALSEVVNRHKPGDTIIVTVVRYDGVDHISDALDEYGNYLQLELHAPWQKLDLPLTLGRKE